MSLEFELSLGELTRYKLTAEATTVWQTGERLPTMGTVVVLALLLGITAAANPSLNLTGPGKLL